MKASRPATFSRREILRLVGLSLVLQPWARADEPLPVGAFEFIAVNDTHFVDELCRPWQARVVAAMRDSCPQAAFCLLVGDVSDRGNSEACAAMHSLYGELGAPLHAVPGNHDYLRENDRSGYDAVFPDRLNYRFEHGGWQFLGLDSTQGVEWKDTEISATTLAWLDDELPKIDPHRPTFVFTHFPLGEGVELRPLNANALVMRLAKLNLRWVHNGHWHGESLHQVGDFSVTTSRCCARVRANHDGSPLKGWHVYRATPDGTLARRFVEVPSA
jgi:Calcineurin-like phosphoesterase